MKSLLFIAIALVISFSAAVSQYSATGHSDTKPKNSRYVIISIDRSIEQSKTDTTDPIEDLKNVAIRKNFDWSKIRFFTDGFQCTRIYFILEENSKDQWDISESFVKILLEYQRVKSFKITDTRNLREPMVIQNPHLERSLNKLK